MAKKKYWKFSSQEKIDLVVSWITLSIAFSLVMVNFRLTSLFSGSTQFDNLFIIVPIAFVAVGTGFVLHELAHRQAAIHYGFVSEFRAWYPMLGLAVIFAIFTGWILAAPGATYFFGNNVSRKQNGIISVAGPVINIITGLILIGIASLISNPLFVVILVAAARINFWFALFNMLPIWILDGTKVLAWDPKTWLIVIGISAMLVFNFEFILLLFGIGI